MLLVFLSFISLRVALSLFSPVFLGIEDLLEHAVQHPVRGDLGDLDAPVGELFPHVGETHPDTFELGVLYLAGVVGVVLLEHLLQFDLWHLGTMTCVN